jgi:hypothetical protein
MKRIPIVSCTTTLEGVVSFSRMSFSVPREGMRADE